MSLPLSPAFTKDGPDHRTKAYVMEKAKVENAKEATRGAPSPLNVLARTASEAPATNNSDQRSAWPRLEDMSTWRLIWSSPLDVFNPNLLCTLR